MLKVLTILTMERSHHRYLLLLRSRISQVAARERTMRVHQVKVHLAPIAHERTVQIGQTVTVRMTERNRHRHVPVDLVRRSIDDFLRKRRIGRDDANVIAFLVQPVGVILRC